MTNPDLNFTLPDWHVPPHPPKRLPWEAYLAWLEENRRELIRSGMLEKILADPNRYPVNARFVL